MMDTKVLNGHSKSMTMGTAIMEEGHEQEQTINDLISTLGHDIVEIRIRALQCLQRKLDHELIPTQDLCKRVDLLNRLTNWLNSSKWTEHELLLIVQFLSTLCQYEDFCNIFRDTPLDKLLSSARLAVRADTRILIDRLMDSVRGHSQGLSFDIHCQGMPEICNDNSSVPFALSSSREQSSRRDELLSQSEKMSKSSSARSNLTAQEVAKSVNSEPELQFYFKRDPIVRDKILPGISTIRLDVSDRRVLASTVESLLSRNEGLIHLTTCFARDVLLNDFPTETFVQECSVSQSLVTVVQEHWEDPKLNYVGFQALYKLGNLLRSRFAILNSSEFYSCGQSHQYSNSQRQKSTTLTTSSRIRAQQYQPQFDSSTDYFLSNLCQLIKTVARVLVVPKSRNIHLWVIMDNLCYTLNVCVQTFNFEPVKLAIQIEEILLDVCECIPKSRTSSEVDFTNPPVQILALIMTSLLNSFEDSLSLPRQIREGIWNLALHPNTVHVSPTAFQQYLDACRLFEPKIAEIGINSNVHQNKAGSPSTQKNSGETEVSAEHIFQDWWKASSIREDGKSESDPNKVHIIRNHFFAIQNATEHSAALIAIEKIWERILPLVLNRRVDGLNVDEEILHGCVKDCEEAFSRFMSVEPTSPEDEDLLARILDVFGFILKFLKDSSCMKEWVGPFVKGSPLRRVLLQHCLRGDGTLMSTVVRSLFDFYVILECGEWMSADAMWEIVCTFTQILHKLSTQGFTSPAVLHSVFHGLTNLTSKPAVIEKLKNNQEFTSGLLDLLCDGLFAIEGRTSTYRNIGSILYGSTSILHLILTLKAEDNSELIRKCFQILPVLWTSDEPRIRAVGFQICSVINSTKKGTTLILWEMDSPIILWEAAYKNLLDHLEPSLVRQKAGCVLLNLINFWDEIVTPQNQNLGLPRWKILQDMLRLLPHIYWNQKLSFLKMQAWNNFKKGESADSPDQLPLITPKLLSIITKIIVATIRTNEFKSSSSKADENEKMILPEICSMLFRLIGNHVISSKMDTTWWIESCNSLNNTVKALISLLHFDPKLTLILITDKVSLAALVKLFQMEKPPGDNEKCVTELSSLWMNVLTLLTIICKEADFEDFEQLILIQRNLIFPTIGDFIEPQAFVKHRKISLDFLKTFLQKSCRDITNEELYGRNKLWQSTVTTHGKNLCDKLLNLIYNSLNVEERSSAFMCCHCLYRISPSLKVQDEKFLDSMLRSITDFGGQKSIQLNIVNLTKKNIKEQEEIVCIVHLLSATVFESETARNIALRKDLPSVLHLILKYAWTNQNLLLGIIECLINFTDDFPKGAHSLTITTGIGVPARKTPTANSIFVELLGLLHRELENVDSNPHLDKTINLLFSLIKNCVFSNECRNCLVKVNILSFIRRLHVADPRKWKQQAIKMSFLNFMLDLSVHHDMQLFIAKLPEAVEILILLAESDQFSPTSISSISLQILRNISFHPGNRLRLLNDSRFMHHIVQRLKNSENSQELETVGVILWAAVSNCEKGKVLSKQSSCGTNILGAIQRLKKRCANQPPGKGLNEISAISLLEKVSKVLDSSDPDS